MIAQSLIFDILQLLLLCYEEFYIFTESPQFAVVKFLQSSQYDLLIRDCGLTHSCSRSDLPLTFQDAALPHLNSLLSHDLVLWTDGSVPSLVKGGSGVLANCSLCTTEATLSFLVGPVCSSFFTETCAILHALC